MAPVRTSSQKERRTPAVPLAGIAQSHQDLEHTGAPGAKHALHLELHEPITGYRYVGDSRNDASRPSRALAFAWSRRTPETLDSIESETGLLCAALPKNQANAACRMILRKVLNLIQDCAGCACGNDGDRSS